MRRINREREDVFGEVERGISAQGPDEFIESLEWEISEILKENPEIKREDIFISTESVPEPWEDFDMGVLRFSWERPETDEEWKARVAREEKEERDEEIAQLKELLEKYPEFKKEG